MLIPNEWGGPIDRWILSLAATGSPKTTQTAYRQRLNHLARRAQVGPWQLDGDSLAGYMAAQNWERETRRGRLSAITAFYGWAIRTGLTKADPAATLDKVKPGDPNPRPVPDRVYLEALIRADADEALWIDLAAEHGLRRAEIAGIHSRDLIETLLGWDLDVHGKGGKRRLVPLTAAMARALRDRGAGYLFPGADDGHVSPRWLGRRVNDLLEGDWTIHKLRHRAATRYWQLSDRDPYAVAELMGWANLNMVRVYVKQPNDRLRAIVEGASRSPSLRAATLA